MPVERRPGPGRPTLYTEELADEICTRIANGETLTSILAEPGKPVLMSVIRWRQRYPEFDKAYLDARSIQADTYFDLIIDTAKNPHPATRLVVKKDADDRVIGSEETTHDAVDHRRIKIDALKWAAGKLHQKYSDKSTINHEGSVKVESNVTLPVDPIEAAKEYQRIMNGG